MLPPADLVTHTIAALLAAYPDHHVVIVERMPGWRWIIDGHTIYIRGDLAGVERAAQEVLDTLGDQHPHLAAVVPLTRPARPPLSAT